MQTVASLAERLDMSPQEAVDKLRYMLFDVEGVDAVISDEEIDILIDLDDDPSVADRIRAAKLKEKEKARKRAENLKKSAAKRKAKAEKEKEKEKEKEAPETAAEAEQRAEAPVAEILPPVPEEAAAAPEEPAAAHFAEILPPEPEPEEAAEPVEPAALTGAPEGVDAVVDESLAQPTHEAPPEIRTAPKEEETAPGIKIGTAIDKAERTVEIVRADGTHLDVPEVETVLDTTAAPAEPEAEEEEESGVLAEAERRQEEEERRKLKFSSRPLAKPDPAVVAEVKRKAAERALRAQQARRSTEGGAAPAARRGGEAGGPARRPMESGAPPRHAASGGAFGRGGAGAPAGGAGVRSRKGKKGERRRDEGEMRRDAVAAVRGYQAGALAGGGPRRRKRIRRREDEESMVATAEEQGPRGVVEVKDSMTVEELAGVLDVPVNDIILDLMDHDILATKNQSLSFDLLRQVAEAHGYEVRAVIPEETQVLAEEPDDPASLKPRAPVVTVMGHVDHGKTSLLDRVRSANVAAGEAGGITQHIAAYDVPIRDGRVVFLDTPGHEAFTQMRARGARVTDIVVLVVAADDGVMPQTIEAIDHAKAAEVPIVVAINKIDKPDAQPDRIRQELTRFDLVDEQWGGKTIIREISAKTGQGVSELLELLELQAELLELKANPNKRARGHVVESEISRGQGPVAWVLVQNGTLRVGDPFLAGQAWGHVRTMHNSRGEQVEEAGPSTPVVVTGFNNVPDAGDAFIVTEDERIARTVAEQRALLSRQQQGQVTRRITLEDLQKQFAAGEKHELNVVLKADVQGSVDVLESSLTKVGNEEVRVKMVHSGVGGINESDVLLASASDAVIIGFHVTANARVQKLAEQEGVDIRTYRVIYEAIEDVRKALEGLLAPESQQVVTGHAEVRAVFRSSAIGNIAGCYVIDGEINRGSQARVIRDGTVVHEGRIGSLRRGKEDARNVQTGFECGIKMDNFEDIKAGDIIEGFKVEAVDRTLP
jgi:translation initiation factor IF-2